jgi:hypothetical protein
MRKHGLAMHSGNLRTIAVELLELPTDAPPRNLSLYLNR